MSSERLRSTLYHSTPKPLSRPPPLWQIATTLDTGAVPAVGEMRRPATSAVQAGWVCVGIGLLTAWFFPLAHVFFSVAIILSVVAMATHQVRSGLGLLAGTLVSMGVCVILFIGGVAMLAAGALHAATKPPPEITSAPPRTKITPVPPRALTTYSAPPTVFVYGPVAEEGTVGGQLRAPATSYATPPPMPARIIVNSPALPATQASQPTVAMPTPFDYAARDRQIATLKKQSDQIDETIRRVRADPHSYGLTSGSTNTARQQSSDAYLEQLDKQRNDLRRQKWALEGR